MDMQEDMEEDVSDMEVDDLAKILDDIPQTELDDLRKGLGRQFPPYETYKINLNYVDIKVDTGNGQLQGLQMSCSTDEYTVYSEHRLGYGSDRYSGTFDAYWYEFNDSNAEEGDSFLDLIGVVGPDNKTTLCKRTGTSYITKIILYYDIDNGSKAQVLLSFYGNSETLTVAVFDNRCLEWLLIWLDDMRSEHQLQVDIEFPGRLAARNNRQYKWKPLEGQYIQQLQNSKILQHLKKREENGRGWRP